MIHHILILFIILITTSPSTSQPNCTRVCKRGDHQITVPYPFGFSGACEIPLNCSDAGEIRVGEYNIQNITNSHILIDFPPKCDRPFQQIYQFNTTNFALTSLNGLLLSNCTSVLNTCVFPANTFGNRFNFPQCGSGVNRTMNCYTADNVGQDEFINLGRVPKSGSCRVLVSSALFDPNGSTLQSRATLELGWWVRGECGCDPNAVCRNVSYENRTVGYRCDCRNGYAGDGFVGGNGCRRGEFYIMLLRIIYNLCLLNVPALGVGGVTIVIVTILCSKGKLRWRKKPKNNASVETFLKNHEFLAPKRYSYSQVKKMTNSFETKLGQGGFGSVYKGVLINQNIVAVKVLSEVKGNGEDFMNEVASVGRTSHVNIVSLVGFCLEGRRRALIYEFMPNGSLERFIYGRSSSSSSQLGWEKLLEIAIGIARGLEYLHKGCNTRILHLDIKPHNILLDQSMCPKISDFGLSKLFPDRTSMLSMSHMRGTPGYIAPELFSRNFGQVSHKSDVYSYGMMVLEMVGGRKNFEDEVDRTSEIYFPQWIYSKLDLDEEQLGLHGIESDEENEMARKMIIVGLWCIQTNPSNRPTITKVLEMLEGELLSLEIPPKPYMCSPSRSATSLPIDESYC
ncbi:PR5-like receptor kinase [Bidens hawaiensis]|uniref:PR5-like receptor kinase n=1 Tax=Bidens hawaiensis TaxID=980011 RepID=UPI00404A4404